MRRDQVAVGARGGLRGEFRSIHVGDAALGGFTPGSFIPARLVFEMRPARSRKRITGPAWRRRTVCAPGAMSNSCVAGRKGKKS